MVKNPIVRKESGVEVTHEALPDIVHTVFIVSFIHLRDALLVGLCFGKVIDMVVLPYVVKTMNMMCANSNPKISAASFRWILHS